FTHGAIVGVTDAKAKDLMGASGEYIAGLLKGNSYLAVEGTYQKGQLGGRDSLMRRLSGTSPVTGRKELVDVYTALSSRGRLVYMIQVVPESDQDKFKAAFQQMAMSFTFLD